MGSLCACVDPRPPSPAAKPNLPPPPPPPPTLTPLPPCLPSSLLITSSSHPPTPPAYMRAPLLFLDSSVGLSPAVTNLRNQTEFDCIESGEYWPSLHVSWVERHFFGEGKAAKKNARRKRRKWVDLRLVWRRDEHERKYNMSTMYKVKDGKKQMPTGNRKRD